MNMPLNIDWQQILLHWFNLGILVGGLYLLLYKPVKQFMSKREEYYQHQEEEIAMHLQNAKSKEEDLQSKLNSVEEEILARRKQADAIMARDREQKIEETRKQCEKLLADAKLTSELERKHIVDSAREEVAQIAIEAVNKLMASDTGDMLDQFLAEEEGKA